MSTFFVDDDVSLRRCLDVVLDACRYTPCLYIDLEGVRLSRSGTISILTLMTSAAKDVYLLDVHGMGDRIFNTASNGQTLKRILESGYHMKVFFDVRTDSDALFAHFGIKLAGIYDIQLVESATRSPPGSYLSGLSECIDTDAGLTNYERIRCKEIKERGKQLFDPKCGHAGSYSVFNERPLSKEIEAYCVQDVRHMPTLFRVYKNKMTTELALKVKKVTLERIQLSQSPSYTAGSPELARAPQWSMVKLP